MVHPFINSLYFCFMFSLVLSNVDSIVKREEDCFNELVSLDEETFLLHCCY